VLFLPPHSPTLIILSRVKSAVIPDFFSEGEYGEGEGGDGEHRRYGQRGTRRARTARVRVSTARVRAAMASIAATGNGGRGEQIRHDC
jgi:hypothetical protein